MCLFSRLHCCCCYPARERERERERGKYRKEKSPSAPSLPLKALFSSCSFLLLSCPREAAAIEKHAATEWKGKGRKEREREKKARNGQSNGRGPHAQADRKTTGLGQSIHQSVRLSIDRLSTETKEPQPRAGLSCALPWRCFATPPNFKATPSPLAA